MRMVIYRILKFPYIRFTIYRIFKAKTIRRKSMSLYIRDNTVDVLARRVQQITKAPNKTEAVRQALQNELTRAQENIPLREQIKEIQTRVAQRLGSNSKPFDMKKFTDDMWDI